MICFRSITLSLFFLLGLGIPACSWSQETDTGNDTVTKEDHGSDAGSSDARVGKQSSNSEGEYVDLRTHEGLQMDVWIDGKRIGPTPLVTRLEPGTHLLTAGAEGIEPVLEDLIVKPGGRTYSVLKDTPLTNARFPTVFKYIVQSYWKHEGNPHILILAAQLSVDREDYQKLLEMIPEQAHSDPNLRIGMARWAMTDGESEKALVHVEEGLKTDDSIAGLWRMKTRALLELDRASEALQAADRAVRIEPMNAENFIARGDAYRALGEPYSARLDYERALELYPGHPRAEEGLRKSPAAAEGAP